MKALMTAFPFLLVTYVPKVSSGFTMGLRESVLKSCVCCNTVFIMIYPLLVLQCLLNPRLDCVPKLFSVYIL